jgi:putative ABC transport system ATP-binding protein
VPHRIIDHAPQITRADLAALIGIRLGALLPVARRSDAVLLTDVRSRKIGFVFQSFYLLPTLTAVENVQIPMFETDASASKRVERATELLESVSMRHRINHLPMQLSVGERQRVAIARALANEPPLLLADEPTGNLDSRSGNDVLDLFDQLHRERGMTLLVITHSQEVAERAERIIWIRDGRIVQSKAEALKQREPVLTRNDK